MKMKKVKSNYDITSFKFKKLEECLDTDFPEPLEAAKYPLVFVEFIKMYAPELIITEEQK